MNEKEKESDTFQCGPPDARRALRSMLMICLAYEPVVKELIKISLLSLSLSLSLSLFPLPFSSSFLSPLSVSSSPLLLLPKSNAS